MEALYPSTGKRAKTMQGARRSAHDLHDGWNSSTSDSAICLTLPRLPHNSVVYCPALSKTT